MAQTVAKQGSFYSSIMLANFFLGGGLLCADSADTEEGPNYEKQPA